ncbi:Thioredoxin domain [Dillenia turbinata]|uniref:Thioredoxin domain n=1 Tax=Dillenia turbinata TaxID=194707 RepID=A0AAN8ZSF9_9MAGN
MESAVASSNGKEDSRKRGLEGTGLSLPIDKRENLKSASSDDDFRDILQRIKTSKTPFVNSGGFLSMGIECRICSQILPAFCRLSNEFPKLSFVYTDIDECPETTQHIRYTPTFQFYRDGERVDEMYGAGEERLHDHYSDYNLQLDIIRTDFKSGLEALLKAKPIRAIFFGVRIGDPTAVGQAQFTSSSLGWPPFMRVNPILDWSYSYTSIGSIYDTVPNSLLSVSNPSGTAGQFRPAYLLSDGRLE